MFDLLSSFQNLRRPTTCIHPKKRASVQLLIRVLREDNASAEIFKHGRLPPAPSRRRMHTILQNSCSQGGAGKVFHSWEHLCLENPCLFAGGPQGRRATKK